MPLDIKEIIERWSISVLTAFTIMTVTGLGAMYVKQQTEIVRVNAIEKASNAEIKRLEDLIGANTETNSKQWRKIVEHRH